MNINLKTLMFSSLGHFTACSNGTFGENCMYKCSEHCFQNETCNKFDGYCPNGCNIGWDGEGCDRGQRAKYDI